MKLSLASLLLALALSPFAASAQQILTNAPPPPPIPETQGAAPSPQHVWVGGYWTWSGAQYTWTQGHWEVPQQQGNAWEAPAWENQGGRYRFRPGRWFRRGAPGVQAGVGVQPGMQPGTQVNVGVQPGMQPGVQPAQGTVWVQPNPPQGMQHPGMGMQHPGMGVQHPGMGVQHPGMGVQQPGMGVQHPGMGVQHPGMQHPGMQQPGMIRMAPPRMRTERRPRVLPNGQIWVPGYWNWDGSQYQWVAGHVENPPSPQVRWRAPQYQRRGGGWVYNPGAWQ
jgi:hypothetical protein